MNALRLAYAILILALMATVTVSAQTFPGLDASPADISYLRKGRGGDVVARIIYSRPQMQGRTIFGDLVPYGEVWRTGANEATEITFYQDVQFNGNDVASGTYTLFTIPSEDSWTVILNSVLHQWGAFSYKQDGDVLRTQIAASEAEEPLENFTAIFSSNPDGVHLILGWDRTRVAVPINYEL